MEATDISQWHKCLPGKPKVLSLIPCTKKEKRIKSNEKVIRNKAVSQSLSFLQYF